MKHSELVKKHSIVLVGNLTQAWHNLPTAPHGPRKPRPCTTVHAPNVGCSDGKAGHRQRQHGSHEQPVERDHANPNCASERKLGTPRTLSSELKLTLPLVFCLAEDAVQISSGVQLPPNADNRSQ